MYSNFLAISETKQDVILRAALREFGRYGYDKTSVDQVAKAAGISKSMVFHYFKNKPGLYLYLLNHSLNTLENFFKQLDIQLEGLDYLEKYQKMTQAKMVAVMKYPEIFEFSTMIYVHPENAEVNPEVYQLFQNVLKYRMELLNKLLAVEGEDAFREDIEPDLAKQYINWIFEGFAQNFASQMGDTPLIDCDIDESFAEFDRIVEDLRKLFYKPTPGGKK